MPKEVPEALENYVDMTPEAKTGSVIKMMNIIDGTSSNP
jgi:hypothetical protein